MKLSELTADSLSDDDPDQMGKLALGHRVCCRHD